MGKAKKDLVPRFGIGEWYGRSFVSLSERERRSLAEIAIAHSETSVNPELPCPFQGGTCTKKGGVCSLRLYKPIGDGEAEIQGGQEGDLRAVCPARLKNEAVYAAVSKLVLKCDESHVTKEVRFLQRDISNLELADIVNEDESEDVGNIDNVLVDKQDFSNWCALEIQTVYFSGSKMSLLFRHIRDFPTGAIPFPDLVRRPDYRSSGPKRLMPQLQIKVPTLRRWGKKMAVVVDAAWFRANVINVPTAAHLSNADIAWCIVHFDESTSPPTMSLAASEFQTLEHAVEGLTGGYPVSLPTFEKRLRARVLELVDPASVSKKRKPSRKRQPGDS